jgi:hypothetical protein
VLYKENRKNRTTIILVAYDELRVQSSIRYLDRFSASKRIVVVNNKKLLNVSELINSKNSWEIIEGSNDAGEFSGWQEALEYLDATGRYEQYIFANDTVVSHRMFSWIRHLAFEYQLSKKTPCFGFCDSSVKAFSLCGIKIKRWISTYIFCMDDATLDKINRSINNNLILKSCIPGGSNIDSFFSGDICSNLQEHIVTWLFCGGWYASQPLNRSNRHAFRNKALAILNEKYLSAALTKQGVALVDPLNEVKRLIYIDKLFVMSKTFLLPESRVVLQRTPCSRKTRPSMWGE